jgi:hypothetical protein
MEYIVNEEENTITIKQCDITVEKLLTWLKTANPKQRIIVEPYSPTYIPYMPTYPTYTPAPNSPDWVVYYGDNNSLK